MERILVVDGDAGFRKILENTLVADGYEVNTASCAREAMAAGGERKYDLLLTDLGLPDGGGAHVLRWFLQRSPETPVIVLAALASVSAALEALKLGAADYFVKPVASYEALRSRVRRTLDFACAARERELLRQQQSELFNCHDIIACDPAMLELLAEARRAAAGGGALLISGESGTGRELLARFIHSQSPRCGNAFAVVRCPELEPTALECRLFGEETRQLGLLELAGRGTLYLQEVTHLVDSLQEKVARLIENQVFTHAGGTREIRADVRVIAATGDSGGLGGALERALGGGILRLPPLRARALDIPVLARFFLSRMALRLGKPVPPILPEAEKAMLDYAWPGNVRELRNTMERAAVLSDGQVEEHHIRAADTPATCKSLRWKEIERHAIEEALRTNGGNRTRTARQLGISLRTLQYRLKEWGAVQAT